MLEAFHKL